MMFKKFRMVDHSLDLQEVIYGVFMMKHFILLLTMVFALVSCTEQQVSTEKKVKLENLKVSSGKENFKRLVDQCNYQQAFNIKAGSERYETNSDGVAFVELKLTNNLPKHCDRAKVALVLYSDSKTRNQYFNHNLPREEISLESESQSIRLEIKFNSNAEQRLHTFKILLFLLPERGDKTIVDAVKFGVSHSVMTTPTCVKQNPTLTGTPSVLSGDPGSEFSVAVILRNNNNSLCAAEVISLSTTNLPQGFSVNFPGSSISLNSGASISGNVSISTLASTTGESFSFGLKATSASGRVGVQNIAVTLSQPTQTCIKQNPTLTLTQSNFTGSPGDDFSITGTIKNNNNQYCANEQYALSLTGLGSQLSASGLNSSATLGSGASQAISFSLNSTDSIVVGSRSITLKAKSGTFEANKAISLTFTNGGSSTDAPVYSPQYLLSQMSYPDYQPPTSGIPDYLQVMIDSLAGNRVMRISDAGIFGVTNHTLRHNYAKDQAWNSDETLIKFAGKPAAILNAETYQIDRWASNFPSYGRWSNIDPKKMFGTSEKSFISYNVDTDQRTILKTFSQFDSVDFGYGEGNQSYDDRYVGLIGKNGNSQTLFVYDITNNVVTGSLNVGSADVDWFSVSQRGGYAVVTFVPNGTGQYQGTYAYTINMTDGHSIHYGSPHGDLAVDQAGNEVFVGYGGQAEWDTNHSLFMSRLDGEGKTLLMPYTNNTNGDTEGIWGGHISARNFDRPGWVYISEQCCSIGNNTASSEIFALKLDSSGTIERIAKHNAKPLEGDNKYGNETQVTVNRNGTKAIFASNWYDPNYLNKTHAPSFVVEIPQPGE